MGAKNIERTLGRVESVVTPNEDACPAADRRSNERVMCGRYASFLPAEAIARMGVPVERLNKITTFLGKAPRFHGMWSHFMDGKEASTLPVFDMVDSGGDLVESAFLIQGLLAARQYFNRDTPAEKELVARITHLWEGMEWDWYRKTPDSDALYWHWTPE